MSSDSSRTEVTRSVIKTMYASSQAGDIDSFLGYLDKDNLVVLEPSFLPYGGEHHGVAGFQSLLAEAGKFIDVATITLESVVADGDIGVVFIRAKTADHGSEVRISERIVVRDGKVVEMRVYFHELGSMAKVIRR